ncbi:hypothetical protein D3C84_1056310 [compost metagenome]
MLEGGLGNSDASVVDYNVRHTPVGNFVKALAYAGRIGYIQGHCTSLSPTLRDFADQCFKLFHAACSHNHSCALSREKPSEVIAQTT